MAERHAEVFVVTVEPPRGRTRLCAVRIHVGCVRVGDRLRVAGADGVDQGDVEVVEIHFAGQMANQIDTNYGGRLLVAGVGIRALEVDQTLTLRAAAPQAP